MLKAYKDYWTHYADFEGRTDRPGYWYVYLWNFLISLPFNLLAWGLFFGTLLRYFVEHPGAAEYMTPAESNQLVLAAFSAAAPGFILWLIWELATLVPNLAISVRRLRDAGFHWGLLFLNLIYLLMFIPLLNIIVVFIGIPALFVLFIVLYAMPSKPKADPTPDYVAPVTPVTPVTPEQPTVVPTASEAIGSMVDSTVSTSESSIQE